MRLAGGDNAIGMIWGDLVGSEWFRGAQTCQQKSWWPVVQVWPGLSERPGR